MLQLAQRKTNIILVSYDNDGNPQYTDPLHSLNMKGDLSTLRRIHSTVKQTEWMQNIQMIINYVLLGEAIHSFVNGGSIDSLNG